jgi:hypothetical protein
MKSIFLSLFLALFGFSALGQKPTPPPPGDISPPPVPPEGSKQIEPMTNARGKNVVPPPKKTKAKRPPVTPPTPEPTAPDQPQDGIQ